MQTMVRISARRLAAGMALVAGLLLHGSIASAAEIRILAANAVRGPLEELAAAFEKTSGHKVTIGWSGTAGIFKRVAGGEAVDLVIIGSERIDRLTRDGKLAPGSRTDFAKSGVGVAVRLGLPKPDLSTEQSVRQAVLDARSIAYSSGPSGVYIAEMLERMGISEQVRHKLVLPPSNVLIGELLARGEADLGFQQVSDLLHVKGIVYAGPLLPRSRTPPCTRSACTLRRPRRTRRGRWSGFSPHRKRATRSPGPDWIRCEVSTGLRVSTRGRARVAATPGIRISRRDRDSATGQPATGPAARCRCARASDRSPTRPTSSHMRRIWRLRPRAARSAAGLRSARTLARA